jgi:nitrite reductase/ring-hydroxylating ferredoxin subunit
MIKETGQTCPLAPDGGDKIDGGEKKMTRRDFILTGLLGVLGTTLAINGAYFLTTIFSFLRPPGIDLEGRTKLGWLVVGNVKDFTEEPKRVDYGDEIVYVYYRNKKLVAFSSACPHVRCIVKFEKDKFTCPCHAASFDLNGKKLSGPPERGLYEQKLKLQGKSVVIGGGTPAA